jgi:UDP-3-O-[3-hydroxymyristoyl] N-acetylglucosamine deacetylase/3-hydroxyacyl-[acyl-carrier-protein] dehydratase
MNFQRTIGKEVTISGVGLHLGSESRLIFKPAPSGSGVVFVRTDLPGCPRIRADIANTVDGVVRRTSVGSAEVMIHTVEHVLAALAGLGIDNVIIESSAPEPPAVDGSALPFVEVLRDAGIVEQDAPRQELKLTEMLSVSDTDKEVMIIPDDKCKITYAFRLDSPVPLAQLVSLEFNEDSFVNEIAPARTFCLKREVEFLKAQGLGKGGDSSNVVVISDDGTPDHPPRLEDEMARHKILDIIGDLYLLGSIPKGHIIGVKSGHDLNTQLIQKIAESQLRGRRMSNTPTMVPLDVDEIKRILPHRYPFLMLDRVIEWEEDKMAVGIKNVTVNEPFFQGHFPQQPIMPGMLQIEALAQLAGVLLFRSSSDDEGSMGYFRSVDKVKFRRAVVPGDQLRLEVQMLKKRGHMATFSGKVLVDGETACEAEFAIAF